MKLYNYWLFMIIVRLTNETPTVPKVWSNLLEILAVDNYLRLIGIVHSIYNNFSQINPYSSWEFAGFENRVCREENCVWILIFRNESINSSVFYLFFHLSVIQIPVLPFSWGSFCHNIHDLWYLLNYSIKLAIKKNSIKLSATQYPHKTKPYYSVLLTAEKFQDWKICIHELNKIHF